MAVQQAQTADASISGMTVQQKRIVVIDDSRASITLYERAAESLQVTLASFESPRAGFDHLRAEDADLIFLGNLMRETDGMSLLRKLRELGRHADTPIIFMSTKDYDQDREMAKSLGAQEYLVKPVRSQTIRELIERYTGAAPRAAS